MSAMTDSHLNSSSSGSVSGEERRLIRAEQLIDEYDATIGEYHSHRIPCPICLGAKRHLLTALSAHLKIDRPDYRSYAKRVLGARHEDSEAGRLAKMLLEATDV